MDREPHGSDDGSDPSESSGGRPHSVEFEWDGESRPSMLIVELVADAVGLDTTEVTPIYDEIDPDALDRLFEDTSNGTDRKRGRVEFELGDHAVCVHSTGQIVVRPLDSPDAEPDGR